MRTFQIHTLLAAILMATLCMGFIGLFVVVPIACIQWTWNSVVVSFSLLPQINVWQAALLYMALAAVVYLTGVVQIHVEAHRS